MPPIDPLILAIVVVGVALACGLYAAVRRREPTLPAAPAAASALPASAPLPDSTPDLARPLVVLHDWLMEIEERADVWPALDQALRELLAEQFGATHVRCYRVSAGAEALETIAQAGQAPGAQRPTVRTGLLGQAIMSGQMYLEHDASHGPLVDELAARDEEHWSWIWPIRHQNRTIGVVAMGRAASAAAPPREWYLALGSMISLVWQHVAQVERLRSARLTDPASGAMRRANFLATARAALAESYAGHEPVVVAVLAIEGLRRLDDTGHWRERDLAIEQLGQLLRNRLRSDDVVGRFSDDRFVILMRRLDSQLAELIISKLLTAGAALLRGDQTGAGPVPQPLGAHPIVTPTLRAGLAGSGLDEHTFDDLMTHAFDALDRARRLQCSVLTDLGPAGPPRCSPGAPDAGDAAS